MARSSMLSSALPVSDTDVVTSLALGHSHSSMFKGVTVSYKGATKVAFWTKRMENAIPDSMGLQTAKNTSDSPMVRKLKWRHLQMVASIRLGYVGGELQEVSFICCAVP